MFLEFIFRISSIFAVFLLSGHIMFNSIFPVSAQQTVTYQTLGCGVREIMTFDVYRIELESAKEEPTLQSFRNGDAPARMRIQIAPDISLPDEPPASWVTRLKPNLSDQDMDAFETVFARVDAGDVMTINYGPERGTRVFLNDREVLQRYGKDLFRTLMDLWVGKNPVSKSLKKEILNGDRECAFG